ncbi:MAG: DUF421 domain-containing protein [Oscillospiraceae bacterium]|nr:DUF421 domain-containing protein [Oscillospiraceae bacterium]
MKYLIIAGSSAAMYIFLIIFIRLFGKKEFAQLSIFDLVFILLISNAVQNAMLSADTSFLGGICSAATLFVVNFIFKYTIYKFPKFSEIVQGHALMLIYDGKIIDENLKKSKISMTEIEETVREHGVSSIEDVNLAVLEIDGSISILSDEFKKSFKKRRRRYNNTV